MPCTRAEDPDVVKRQVKLEEMSGAVEDQYRAVTHVYLTNFLRLHFTS